VVLSYWTVHFHWRWSRHIASLCNDKFQVILSIWQNSYDCYIVRFKICNFSSAGLTRIQIWHCM
jgi:hypothetical protein